MLDLVRLLRVPSVDAETGYDLSPDGTKLAFSWNLTGQWELYEISFCTAEAPVRLTSGPGSKFGPRYSPDGLHLAYAVDLDGGENYHLFLYTFATNHCRDLTPGIAYTIQPSFDWSPDGREIAFLSNRTGCFSAFTLDVISGEERLVFANGYPAVQVRWSPAGDWLALCAETGGQDHGIYLAPLCKGTPFQLSDHSTKLNCHHPSWSPDGKFLAFCSDANGEFNLGIYSTLSGGITWLNGTTGEKSHPAWSPDANHLVAVVSQGADSGLLLIDLEENNVSYRVGHGLHSLPEFTLDGRALVCIFESPCQPPDLWRLALPDGLVTQLTNSLPSGLCPEQFVIPEEIRYPGQDGADVPALLYCPPGLNRPAPALVNIHGGPGWLYQFSWYPLMAHAASRGWVVLAPNYRGSTGYGRNWQLANRFDIGGVDTRDVVAGAEYLIQQGLADPARIVVTGRSHGGYLTMSCLTQFPELWAGGSAVVPFLNWFTSHENSRSDLQHWDIENMGSPQEYHDLWHERSPYFYLEKVLVPVQLICGAHDPRCPASESQAARDRLLSLGKTVDFHLYPDEGHVFLNVENLIDAEQRRVNFLARLLE